MNKIRVLVVLFLLASIPAFALVPVENIVVSFGMKMTQKGYTSRYTLEKEGSNIIFGPGISQVIINGTSYPLDGVPVFRNGSLHVPDNFEELIRKNLASQAGDCWQTVTLDPGHGGKDPGAISPVNGLQEKDVVLPIALHAKQALEQAGVKVIMTRTSDISVPLESRANSANSTKSNLFVSIHANYIDAPSIAGVEVYYGDDWPTSNIDCSTRAYFLAGSLDLNHFNTGSGSGRYSRSEEAFFFRLMLEQANRAGKRCAQIIAKTLADGLNTENRGIKTKNLRVIRRCLCPSILIEVGFLSNRTEARLLKDPAYQKKAGGKIAQGIIEYLRREEKKK